MDSTPFSAYDGEPDARLRCRDVIEATAPAPDTLRPASDDPLRGAKVLLAPLCGITDAIFRKICLGRGADMVTTEMISSEGLVRNSNHVRAIRDLDMAEGPLSLQIFGNDPESMGEAAAILSELGPRFIDMNFGCPARKIVSKSGGSAILRDPKLLYRICRRVVERSRVPVSAKIRSGWDKPSAENLQEIGTAVEDAGVSMLTVHARTKKQAFKGTANWSLIRELKDAVSIPVVGNGDVIDAGSYFRIKEESGCDAVMVGRGAIGNPWVFEEIKAALEQRAYDAPGPAERVRVLLEHLRLSVESLGEPKGVILMRKIMAAYLKRLPNARELRGKIMTCEKLPDLERLFDDYLTELDAESARGALPESALPAAG